MYSDEMQFESFNKSLLKLFFISWHHFVKLDWSRSSSPITSAWSVHVVCRKTKETWISEDGAAQFLRPYGGKLTTVVKLVDFHLVDSAEGGGLSQPNVVVLWDDGRLPPLRVGVPEGVHAILWHVHHTGVHFFIIPSATHVPKCMTEL